MPVMTNFSILDLSPITQGSDASQSLANSLDLARAAERLGYRRYWLAEHHNMPGIASAATAVVIGHVAAGTSTIRVGAGGIMLPNHAPLMVAEAFGTLAALFPGRIDLGVGRAPGTDQVTARALRRTLVGDIDAFPQDVLELIGYFREAEPGQRVRAVPGAGQDVPVWILGSSLYGAQLAAHLGLPYAFASHFAPAELDHAVAIYRERFQPSEFLDKPYVMLGLSAFCADTDEEARLLFTSQQQAFVNLRSGRAGLLPPPDADFRPDAQGQAMLDHALACAVVGSPATVKAGLDGFIARTRADELMLTAQIYDHAARVRSYEMVAQAAGMTPSPSLPSVGRATRGLQPASGVGRIRDVCGLLPPTRPLRGHPPHMGEGC
jgi:luciferase family oxidoreductase group 1